MSEFTRPELVECVKRELRMRERAYPGWVARGRMSAKQKDREIAMMREVLAIVSEGGGVAADAPQGDLFSRGGP